MSFLDIVSKFNQQATSHSQSQSLNPFSERFEQSRSPSPRFSREEYGKPIAGSKTDLRGRKAKTHICREILELCTVIHDVGTYNAKKKDPGDSDDEQDDGTIIVSFGELFQIYTKISDKVVGLLIAAKRRGFVYFDREILFQRRDDDVLIALMKPISEISKILKDDINQTNQTTATVEPMPIVEKTKSSSSNKTKRTKSSSSKNPNDTMIDCAVTVDQANVVSASTTVNINDEEVVKKTGNEGPEDSDQNASCCNGEVNGWPEDNEQSCTNRFDQEVNGDGLLVVDNELNVNVDAGVSKNEVVEVPESKEDEIETKVSNETNGDVDAGVSKDEVVKVPENTENKEGETETKISNESNSDVDTGVSKNEVVEVPESKEDEIETKVSNETNGDVDAGVSKDGVVKVPENTENKEGETETKISNESNSDVDTGVSKDEIVKVPESKEGETETKISNEPISGVTKSANGIDESVEADNTIVREEIENKMQTAVEVSLAKIDHIEISKESEEVSNNGKGKNIGEVMEHDVALLPMNEN